MTTTEITARIVEIDAECRELYRKGGKYMGINGKPTSFRYPEGHAKAGQYTATNGNGWEYIKGRYAELKRERESLATAMGSTR